jgi:ribosomal protein L11 methylase PrmA
VSNNSLSHTNESFRDPAGFVFKCKETVYRQINQDGKDDYDFFMESGLYKELSDKKLIVEHREVKEITGFKPDSRKYKLIKPTQIQFISYPYEWSFSQLKEAAILTLRIQKIALKHGMILKDSSAYNVQFTAQQKPIFIDTLSFRKYEEGAPWEGYKQFCEHFIAPLALSSFGALEILAALRVFIDGIPLETAVTLLPGRAKLKRGLFPHLYLHASTQKRYESIEKPKKNPRKVSKLAMEGLLASLEKTIKGLELPKQKTEWGQYYSETNYSSTSFSKKAKIIDGMLQKVTPNPKMVWDLGANDGTFSEITAKRGIFTISWDIDPNAVDQNYNKDRAQELKDNILPLTQNLANPSPALGWSHEERASLVERGPADVALALALIHHLAIGNNSPLPAIAAFFSKICNNLIIEFVPQGDSKVDMMLASRTNIFSDYTEENFEKAFEQYFKLKDKKPVSGSKRSIYLYQKLK